MTHLFALSAAATDIMSISLRSRLSAARLTYIDSLHGASRQQSFTASLLLDEAVRRCFPSVPRPLDIAANENRRAGCSFQPVAFRRMGSLCGERPPGRRGHSAVPLLQAQYCRPLLPP